MLPQQKDRMTIQCSWCSAAMGEKPGPVGTVSHGLCAVCAAKLHAELDAKEAA